MNKKQEIIRAHLICTCDEAYKNRNMVDPTCFLCEYESEIEEMMDEYFQTQVEKLRLGGCIKSVCVSAISCIHKKEGLCTTKEECSARKKMVYND
jgi:hypothetical protein